jgi:malto-oligosyltrehalose trehalohydrolase
MTMMGACVSGYTFGPITGENSTAFRLWAPKQTDVRLAIAGRAPVAMKAGDGGWFRIEIAGTGPGTRYSFILGDGTRVPDPASRYQPEDVHGPSEVIDPRYEWACADWTGRPWIETVLYELHVGAFTPEGTFRAAIGRLDHLRDLGITAIQLMPIADFRGGRGWGYDGVLHYAPDASYGRPDDLKALVDEAHKRSISVFLDVVYNHFGPDGNYLPLYAPVITDSHTTPWGPAMNFDGEGSEMVRDFFIENALYWLTEFRMDGMRFDAVHALKDDSNEHILYALARRIGEATQGRHIHLVVENEENDVALLERDGQVPRMYVAQWNDDIHHALHCVATGEDFGYYRDYAGDLEKAAKALAEGFVFQGEIMPFRGTPRGKPSAHLPPTTFVSFIQNHDQIGNRAYGDRMAASVAPERLRALAAIYLLAPQIPMLFMGEEWGAKEPFPYFCDFDEELNEKVRRGRSEELAHLPGFNGDAEDAPDATSEQTFLSAKLDWALKDAAEGSEWMAFYRSLLDLRRAHIVPILDRIGTRPAEFEVIDGVIHVRWFAEGGDVLSLVANLSDNEVSVARPTTGRLIFPSRDACQGKIGPWFVLWSIERA